MLPESHALLVLVCVTESLLVNVTLWPGLTVRLLGANAKLAMLTLAAPDGLAAAGAAGAGCDAAAVGAEAAAVGAAAGIPAIGATAPGWTTIFLGALPTG